MGTDAGRKLDPAIPDGAACSNQLEIPVTMGAPSEVTT
jgi:hypothetical protein